MRSKNITIPLVHDVRSSVVQPYRTGQCNVHWQGTGTVVHQDGDSAAASTAPGNPLQLCMLDLLSRLPSTPSSPA